MQKKKIAFVKFIKLLLKVGVMCAYFGLIVVLMMQALTPGEKSSNISNSVGDKIDQIVTEIQKPQQEHISVESVAIVSVTCLGQTYKGESITLPVDATGKVKTQVKPNNASNPALLYSSSDEECLKVYADGKIETLCVGSANLTITSKEDESLKSTISITVKDIPLENIKISNKPQEFHVGQTLRLEVAYTPKNTSQRSVKWESSDKSILTVSSSGVIKGQKEGIAVVSVTSTAGDFSDSITVQVLPKKETPIIPVEGVDIEATDLIGYIGSTSALKASILPKGASDQLLWFSSNEEVATVSQSGVVTCISAGETTITVKCSHSDFKDSVTFIVKEVLSGNILLEYENLSSGDGGLFIKQGKSGKVIAHLDESATVHDVSYISSDPKIAQINSDGVIQALKGGVVTITVSTSYDGQTTEESFTLTINKITFSDNVKNFYYWVRKAFGHFGAFLVLGIFAVFTYYILFPKSSLGKIVGFAVCLFAGFAVAGITEILQLPIFTPGRTCSFNDVMIDFKGYCSSVLIMYFVILAVHFIKLLINKRKVSK